MSREWDVSSREEAVEARGVHRSLPPGRPDLPAVGTEGRESSIAAWVEMLGRIDKPGWHEETFPLAEVAEALHGEQVRRQGEDDVVGADEHRSIDRAQIRPHVYDRDVGPVRDTRFPGQAGERVPILPTGSPRDRHARSKPLNNTQSV